MRPVAMVGAGMIPFGELFHLGMKEMLPAALGEALASVDNGLQPSDIDAVWFGQLQASDGHPAGVLADSCGLLEAPVTRVENQCATGNDAVRQATYAIASGYVDIALVIGCGQDARDLRLGYVLGTRMGLARDRAWDYPLGLIDPGELRPPRDPVHARVLDHARALGDGGGEEPSQCCHQSR